MFREPPRKTKSLKESFEHLPFGPVLPILIIGTVFTCFVGSIYFRHEFKSMMSSETSVLSINGAILKEKTGLIEDIADLEWGHGGIQNDRYQVVELDVSVTDKGKTRSYVFFSETRANGRTIVRRPGMSWLPRIGVIRTSFFENH